MTTKNVVDRFERGWAALTNRPNVAAVVSTVLLFAVALYPAPKPPVRAVT